VYVIDDYNVPGPTGHSVRLRWRGMLLVLARPFPVAGAFAVVAIFGTISLAITRHAEGAVLMATLVALLSWIGARSDPQRMATVVTWEARDHELRIQYEGFAPLLGEEVVVQFEECHLVEFEIGSEGHGEVGLRCRIVPKGGSVIDLPMTVRNIDTQAKAVDLALRIGAAMGLTGYRVTRCTPRSIRVQLQRDGTPLPARDDDPSYELAHDESVVPLPDYQIAPFRPETYKGPFRLVTWEPGGLVRFERPGPSRLAHVVASVLAGALGHLGGILVAVVSSPIGLTHHPMSDWRVWVMTALGLVGGWVGLHLYWGDIRIEIDWGTRTFTRCDGLGRWEREFGEVAEVLLRGRSTAVQPRGIPKWAYCWCEVILHVGFVDLAIPSTRFRGDPEAPYEMMLPMAVDLAKAMGIPWRWQEDVATRPQA